MASAVGVNARQPPMPARVQQAETRNPHSHVTRKSLVGLLRRCGRNHPVCRLRKSLKITPVGPESHLRDLARWGVLAVVAEGRQRRGVSILQRDTAR